MGWVVKQWRMEALEQLLSADARARADIARAAAGRDARRARRAADRTAAVAAAELAALERLGAELHGLVRDGRAALRSADAAAPAAAARAAPTPTAAGTPRRRPGRASLRGSGLGELFRATAPR
jgi:hypothetical protein